MLSMENLEENCPNEESKPKCASWGSEATNLSSKTSVSYKAILKKLR